MKRSKYRKSHHSLLILGVLSLSVVCWGILLYFVPPTEIVETIGVENGYAIMFLVALFGGMSSFSAVSYVATVLTLVAGGLNPILLALASGLGISLSDTLFFWIGRHSHLLITSPKLVVRIERAGDWLAKRNKFVVGLFIYVYTGFTPLPTDLVTMALGLTRQPYLLVVTAVTLGNFTFTYLLATLGTKFFVF